MQWYNINNNSIIWTREYILILIINVLTFLGFNMSTAGLPIYISQLSANEVQVGMITTCAAVAALIIRPIAGITTYRITRKGSLLIGLVLMSLAAFFYFFTPAITIILVARVIHGIGWGISSTASSTLAADVILPNKLGKGIGYVSFATSFATALAPFIGASILIKCGMSCMLIIILLSSILSGLLLLNKTIVYKPAQNITNRRKDSYKLFERKALLPAIVIVFVTSGYSAIVTFVSSITDGIGTNATSLYFAVYAFFTILARPVTGILVDKIGSKVPTLISLGCLFFGLIILAMSYSYIMISASAVLTGVSVGVSMVALQTLAVKDLNFRDRGIGIATFLFGFDFGMALGAVLAGYIANLMGYKNMYLLMAVIPLIGIMVYTLSELLRKHKE